MTGYGILDEDRRQALVVAEADAADPDLGDLMDLALADCVSDDS